MKTFASLVYPGSSPRGRGTPEPRAEPRSKSRFIPAWAGNTGYCYLPFCDSLVHPRVGGEHRSQHNLGFTHSGSSPRGRGTLWGICRIDQRSRFIPAWAGNTTIAATITQLGAVHPRVGGEHIFLISAGRPSDGSSPRGRGTLRRRHYSTSRDRFIPAWAGNTPVRQEKPDRLPVHPRVGGEHFAAVCKSRAALGSSPRGRGTRGAVAPGFTFYRFIPAWAGNTGETAMTLTLRSVHPRVGGEHAWANAKRPHTIGSSPRGRGTLAGHAELRQDGRFIPAWAGNTCARSSPM